MDDYHGLGLSRTGLGSDKFGLRLDLIYPFGLFYALPSGSNNYSNII